MRNARVHLPNDMLRSLSDYHRRIAEGIAHIRMLCEAAVPDMADLQAARYRLGQISEERGRFIDEVVVPRLLASSAASPSRDILALQRSFAKNRLISTGHVATWTEVAIERDWDGYRQAVALIWPMMEAQMERERLLLGRYLKRMQL